MTTRRNISELEFPPRLGLATSPSLRWEVESAKAGDRTASLSYLTFGIEWNAEYTAMLESGEKEVELTGWASIVNRTGTSFDGAKVSLVAGGVPRARGEPDRGPAAAEAPPKNPPRGGQELLPHHLFTPPRANGFPPL